MKNRMRSINGHASLINLKMLVVDGQFIQSRGIKEVLRLVRNKKLGGVYVANKYNNRRVNLHNLAEIYEACIENGAILVTYTRSYDLRWDKVFFFDIEGLSDRYYREENPLDGK